MGTGLAIAAIVISVLSAIYSARVSYQVAGSRFRVSENFLSDLATLLAALRSIAAKGAIVMGEARDVPIPIDTELDTVRAFTASTSGLALALQAGAVGSAGAADDKIAGAWRVLRFHFANLASMKITSRSDSQNAGKIALDIERTLSTLDKDAIKSARQRIRNLPDVLSSLENSRKQDILLSGLDHTTRQKVTKDGDEDAVSDASRRLRQLKDSGVVDPDIDMWLALFRGDEGIAELKDALDRGAHVNATLGEVLSRHEDDSSQEAVEGSGSQNREVEPARTTPDDEPEAVPA